MRLPDFAAYHVATFCDGHHSLTEVGDWTIWDDGKTYVYRAMPVSYGLAWFLWAHSLFCEQKSEPHRLVGSFQDGFRVESNFKPPEPIPSDDSPDYQRWLDVDYREALLAWELEYAPR